MSSIITFSKPHFQIAEIDCLLSTLIPEAPRTKFDSKDQRRNYLWPDDHFNRWLDVVYDLKKSLVSCKRVNLYEISDDKALWLSLDLVKSTKAAKGNYEL